MSPRSEEFMAEYAARAALSEEGRFAKTHSGVWTQCEQAFVVSELE